MSYKAIPQGAPLEGACSERGFCAADGGMAGWLEDEFGVEGDLGGFQKAGDGAAFLGFLG